MRTLLRLIPVAIILTIASSAYALSPVACTMDAKLCPDGKTYVGRDGLNNCEWEKCPGEEQQCAPYVCMNGKTHPRCSDDGHVINYVAAPCHMDGGEVSELFNDVPDDHLNAEAIAYVKAQRIISGYSDGTYRPDDLINRAEFTKILVQAQAEASAIQACYDEVEPAHWSFSERMHSEWYAPFVCYAKKFGLIDGYPDGSFRPAANINFAEAAKILAKAFGLEARTTILACDGECPWYRSYVLMLEMQSAIPTSITGFNQNITRGEMAEMIWRLKTGNNDIDSGTYDGMGYAEFRDDAYGVRFLYPAELPYPALAYDEFRSDGGIPYQSASSRVMVRAAYYGGLYVEGYNWVNVQKEAAKVFTDLASNELVEIVSDEEIEGGGRMVVYEQGGMCGNVEAFVVSYGRAFHLASTCGADGPKSRKEFEVLAKSFQVVD